MQSVNQKSGSAFRELQNTIQSYLTALKMSGTQTENCDSNNAEIPTWQELNAFLTERQSFSETQIKTKYTRCHRYRVHGLHSPKLLCDVVYICLAGYRHN